MSIKEALERYGYAVIRDVFSAEEIAQMRGEAMGLITTEARPLNGGLCSGPVPCYADLARRLLQDARLAFHHGGELPCEIHVQADTYNGWHVDFEPPTRKRPTRIAVISVDSAWIYKIAI